MAKDPRKLKADAQKAVDKGKPKKALECYLALETLEPRDGQWPRRVADCHRRLEQPAEELLSLQRAVDRYARAGFLVKAIAVCKRILQVDPAHVTALQALAELEAERGIPQVQRAAPPSESPRTRTLPAGVSLGEVALNQVVPDARAVPDDAGRPSGVFEIPLDLGDVGVAEEPAPAAVAAETAAAEVLPRTPLFSELDQTSLASLIRNVGLVELPPQAPLFREGDAADALYVVADGAVDVVAEGPPRTRLGRLEDGAFFGEIALLTRQPRRATVEAAESGATLLRLELDVLGELIHDEPGVLKVLLRFLRGRLIDSLIKTSPLFAPFGGGDRAALASRFSFLEIERGAVLIRQGDRADGLYALLSGRAEVTREHEGEHRRLATLEAGDLFGEMSLLTHEPAVASVRAETHGFALRMPATAFRDTIMTHPQVLAFVGDLADERRARNEAIADGEADYGEGRIDLL